MGWNGGQEGIKEKDSGWTNDPQEVLVRYFRKQEEKGLLLTKQSWVKKNLFKGDKNQDD